MPGTVADRRGALPGVLLIGFEPGEAARLTAALAQAGRPAYSAAGRRSVADLLATAPIGVALADLKGPFHEVLQAIEAVRASRPHRPLLGVGSVGAGAAMADALRVLGFEGFIPSGVSPQELIFRVNGALYPDRRAGSEASPRVPTDLPATFDGLYGPVEGCVLSLSATGLFLAAEQLLPTNRTVTVRFTLQPAEGPITVTCRVVWTNPGGEGQGYFRGMGLQFLSMQPAAEAAVRAFLARALAAMAQAPAD
jgi:Tfp pilus assembly protein PilZ